MSDAVQTQSEVVQMQVEDGVAVLTLNRPDRLNAWTAEMEPRTSRCSRSARTPQDVRVIVVTGAGRGFCAGADMQDLQAIGEGDVQSERGGAARHPQTLPAVDPQADHRGDQRRVRGHRPGAGAYVRHPLRRRGREADDRVRPPRAGGRARHLVDAAAAGGAGEGARPAALRPRGVRRGGARARAGQPRARTRAAARRDARVRARAGRQLLAREHGHDEAPGLRRPAARASRTRSRTPTG